MHIVDLIYGVIDKFAPMEATEKSTLRKDAMEWYLTKRDTVFKSGQNKVLHDGLDIKQTTLVKKIIYYCEQWYVRTGLAILFIIIIPSIQDMYDRKDDDDDDK